MPKTINWVLKNTANPSPVFLKSTNIQKWDPASDCINLIWTNSCKIIKYLHLVQSLIKTLGIFVQQTPKTQKWQIGLHFYGVNL